MTPKRAHGPCTCGPTYDSEGMLTHIGSCPSLYPAQQEPDALTLLAREIRNLGEVIGSGGVDVLLSLISEARAEMGDLRNRAEKAEHAVRRVTQILEDAVRGGQ